MADDLTERPWGYLDSQGVFVELPKTPMKMGGYGPPPFDVTRPDGVTLHVIEKPERAVDQPNTIKSVLAAHDRHARLVDSAPEMLELLKDLYGFISDEPDWQIRVVNLLDQIDRDLGDA